MAKEFYNIKYCCAELEIICGIHRLQQIKSMTDSENLREISILRGQGQKTVLCNIHCTDSTADIFKKDPETKMASLDKSSLKIRRVRLKKNIL